jgi:hypothetical protein
MHVADPGRPSRRCRACIGVGIALALPGIAMGAVPLVTFTPLTATTLTLPINADASVRYQVTNQSTLQRTFDMTPIAGVEVVAGIGNCSTPFTLSAQQSCVLELHLTGSEMAGDIDGGPVVCISGSPLQCYQPGVADVLHVTLDADPIFDDGFDG